MQSGGRCDTERAAAPAVVIAPLQSDWFRVCIQVAGGAPGVLHVLHVLQVAAAPLQREGSHIPDDVHAALLMPDPAPPRRHNLKF